ncbi:MAG: response regulator [Xanthobacteraceae bacterium]
MDHDDEMKRDLECLRLASDFTALSRDTLDAALQAHCARMATYWSDQANGGFDGDVVWNDEPEKPATGPLAVVLVVEDDPLLRELAVTLVKEAGFVALQAGGADGAVAVLEARSDIAVLFTDIDMPGSMNGLKLAQVVGQRWPQIRTLVASGQIRPRSSELPPNGAFLAKPYRGAAVVAQLRSMVGPV